jgi:hypothetical protein
MKGALAGLVAKANALDAMSARVAKIEKDANARAHSTLIDEAKAARRITPHQAKQLRSKPLAFVRSYLEMHTKPLVNTDSTDLAIPRDGKVATGKLDAELEKIISHAISSSDGKLTREAILADYAKTLNGAGGAGSY